MTNIEIKARYHDSERAEENLNALGAGAGGDLPPEGYLFQRHPRTAQAARAWDRRRSSDFLPPRGPGWPQAQRLRDCKTEDPEGLRNILSSIHGVWVEVEKTRQVWLWENVRIHLDDVKGLGQFVELEAVTEEKGIEESHRRVEALMRALEITSDQLVTGSYGDIVAAS